MRTIHAWIKLESFRPLQFWQLRIGMICVHIFIRYPRLSWWVTLDYISKDTANSSWLSIPRNVYGINYIYNWDASSVHNMFQGII